MIYNVFVTVRAEHQNNIASVKYERTFRFTDAEKMQEFLDLCAAAGYDTMTTMDIIREPAAAMTWIDKMLTNQ